MPDHPESVTGGCLCGAVRYALDFSNAENWPPGRVTCQCTQCRKWTGALMAPLLDVKASQLSYSSHHTTSTTSPTTSPTSLSSYAEYSASPGCYRGFCTTCGSTLLWRSEKRPEKVEILTGTLDESVLRGEWGVELARAADGHFWAENAVKGVTDQVREKLFVKGSGSEEVKGGESGVRGGE